jgi:hypothetical protein
MAVSDATLYHLLARVAEQLQAVYENQAKCQIELYNLTQAVAALRADTAARYDTLKAKLDKIIVQVTPPETGEFNP